MGSKFAKNTFIIYIGVLSGILLAWNIYLQINPDKNTLFNYLYNFGYALLYLSAGGIALFGFKMLHLTSKISKSLLYLGLGSVSYALALMVWVYFNVALKVTIPYPSVADVFFLLFYPLLGAGILITLNSLSLVITKRVIAEAIVVGLVAIFAIFLLDPPEISGNIDLLTRFFNLAYPLSDVVLVSLIYIGTRVSSGKMNLGLIFLVLGLIFQTIGDFVFTYRNTNNLYWNGDIADLTFTLSALMLGLGFVYIISDLTSLYREN